MNSYLYFFLNRDIYLTINKDRAVIVVIVYLLDCQLHVQSVHITLKLWVRIPFMARCTRYNIS